MHLLFFISHLDTGGTQRQLTLLAEELSTLGHKISLVTIYRPKATASHINNVNLFQLFTCPQANIFLRLLQIIYAPLKLRSILKKEFPDICYSMLEFSNLIAWFATRGKYSRNLIWGFRSSEKPLGWKMRFADSFCALLSRSVPLLIANSHYGLLCATKRFYRPKRSVVIHNGIDTKIFSPKPSMARHFRESLGLSSKNILIGLVARISPEKGHISFIRAAAKLIKTNPEYHFLCVGDGSHKYKKYLQELAHNLGLCKKLIWLGNQNDMPLIYSALDILVSASYSEGFSNAICEAMACGVPCVATNVGDSAVIVGRTGLVIRSDNVSDLCINIPKLIESKSNNIVCPRDRILKNFSVKTLIDRTLSEIGY